MAHAKRVKKKKKLEERLNKSVVKVCQVGFSGFETFKSQRRVSWSSKVFSPCRRRRRRRSSSHRRRGRLPKKYARGWLNRNTTNL